MMMQSSEMGASVRLRRLAAIAPIVALLSGCGFSLPLLSTAEPYEATLMKLQQNQLLEASLGAMPQEIADGLPDEHVANASRFLTRALETTPDGQNRYWRSLDRKTALNIRPVSTSSDEGVVCRYAVLSLVTSEFSRDFNLDACRLKNGTWVK